LPAARAREVFTIGYEGLCGYKNATKRQTAKYLACKTSKVDDAYKWWICKAERLSSLCNTAATYLATPATSVPSERASPVLA